MTKEISARDTKIEELGGEISTLTTERDEAIVARDTASASLTEAETELSELRTSVETLTIQNATLADFQYRTLKAEKEGVISGYTNMLSMYREARAAAKISHPNVVQAYAIGEEDGIFYF